MENVQFRHRFSPRDGAERDLTRRMTRFVVSLNSLYLLAIPFDPITKFQTPRYHFLLAFKALDRGHLDQFVLI
jgi:hypothetical protein